MPDGEVITFKNWYINYDHTRLENIEFADGTVWGSSQMLTSIEVEGQSNDVDTDAALGLLIQSFSSFDDSSDELDFTLDKRALIVTPIDNEALI